MVGRLARYLRMLGEDTEYAHGRSPAEIVEWAGRERRILVTRNPRLAKRVPASVVLTSVELPGQLQELVRAFPGVSMRPQRTRCTLCNGKLTAAATPSAGGWPEGVPVQRVHDGLALFECASCHHLYWSGSHTERLEIDLARWFPTAAQ